jgi:hypothetical protein
MLRNAAILSPDASESTAAVKKKKGVSRPV